VSTSSVAPSIVRLPEQCNRGLSPGAGGSGSYVPLIMFDRRTQMAKHTKAVALMIAGLIAFAMLLEVLA
jgi:hypothetical protein